MGCRKFGKKKPRKKSNGAWKKLIGYTMFCIAFGMCVMWVLPEDWMGFLVIVGLFMLGYHLFCG